MSNQYIIYYYHHRHYYYCLLEKLEKLLLLLLNSYTKYNTIKQIKQMWNSLPENVILADNVNQFKNRLDKHWKMHDIVFNYGADFAETGGLA